jgi:GT2 family glycosyltransferase
VVRQYSARPRRRTFRCTLDREQTVPEQVHLLHIDWDMTQPFVAGCVSGAGSMMPLAVFTKVGHLDDQFFYHVDADHCKRVAEAGYKCYYLPSDFIDHLNHKAGTTASLSRRFRSLLKFELDSYRYYRKHMKKFAWTPMQLVVALGFSFHFLALASAQALAEFGLAVRPRSQRGILIGARTTVDRMHSATALRAGARAKEAVGSWCG